jgi:hypothetical protein
MKYMKKYYKAICFLFVVLIIGILYKIVFMKTVEGHGSGGRGGGHGGIGTGGYGGYRGMAAMGPVYLDSYYDYDYYPSMQTYPPAAVYYPPPPPLAMRYGQGYGQRIVVAPPNYFPYY